MEQILDTAAVQIQSVVAYMSALGFVPDLGSKKLTFINQSLAKTPNMRVSFGTAVKMHNAPIEKWMVVEDSGMAVIPHLGIKLMWPTITVLLAKSSKLVESVKLAVNKHGHLSINSQNAHYIRPLNATIAQLLSIEPAAQE